jgi:hypothetical protein
MARFIVTLYDRAKKRGKELGFIEADNAHDATLKAWRRWTHQMPSHCLFVHETRFRTCAEAVTTAGTFDPQIVGGPDMADCSGCTSPFSHERTPTSPWGV